MEKLIVYVVDDEPGIRSGVTRSLEGFAVTYPFMDEDICFEVKEIASGEEAMARMKEDHPDIMLLDNKLPAMDGVEVLEYINANELDIEVMMITSFASLELAVKATNMGAYDFVPKPFTPQELRSSMENITKHLFLKRMTRKMNREGRQIRFQFLSILSHELKTPLNAVEGFLNIIKERQLGESLENYDDVVSRAVQRVNGMIKLIMDFLDLTQIETGKKSRKIRKLDVVKIAQSCMDALNPLAIHMEVELILDRPPSVACHLDQDDLEIVLNNLLSNAIKYNRTKGSVVCQLRLEQGLLLIVVKDSGIGISSSDQEKLFHEFVRIKNDNTRHIAGSGLGLSITKRVVDYYGGLIQFTSEEGIGSTFTIRFPQR